MVKKRVLFLCVENSARSQMAEGFTRALAGGSFDVYSAGSRPSGLVNPKAIKVMQEAGIDISSQRSKGFEDLPASCFDYVITLGCKDVCPYLPASRHIEWKIADPGGRGIAFFRKIRDNIKREVKDFIKTTI
jgi:protein-tyrosine-phosphatase